MGHDMGLRHKGTTWAHNMGRGTRSRHGRVALLTNSAHLFSFLRTAILRASGKLSTSPSKTGHVGTRGVGESPTTALICACHESLRLLPSKHEESCPSEQNHRRSRHGTQMRVFPQRGRECRIATQNEMRRARPRRPRIISSAGLLEQSVTPGEDSPHSTFDVPALPPLDLRGAYIGDDSWLRPPVEPS